MTAVIPRKLSELTALETLAPTDVVHVVRGGVSYQATVADLLSQTSVEAAARDVQQVAAIGLTEIIMPVNGNDLRLMLPHVDGVHIRVDFSDDGGATWLGQGNYDFNFGIVNGSGTPTGRSTGDSDLWIHEPWRGLSYLHVEDALTAAPKMFWTTRNYSGNDNLPQWGIISRAAAFTHIRVKFSGPVPNGGTVWLVASN